MTENNISLIVYDCDGVIINSKKAVFAYYDIICEKFNLKKFNWNNKKLVSDAMMKTSEEMLFFLSDDDQQYREMLDCSKNIDFKQFINLIELEPYIRETVDQLNQNGYKLAIFTNRGYSLYYLLFFFSMKKYFDFIVTSKDVSRPKPYPDGLLKIISHFDTNNQNVLFIGDSDSDYMAADNANISFIGYKNSFNGASSIKSHSEIFNYL